MNWDGLTISEALRRSAREFADDEFAVGMGQRLTFARMDALVDRFAEGLLSIGVGRGDHVANWLTNCPSWTLVWMACCRIGATMVSLNTRYKTSEIEFILRQSDAKVLVAMDRFWNIDFRAMIEEMVPGMAEQQAGALVSEKLPDLKSVVFWNDVAAPGAFNIDELLARGEEPTHVAAAEAATRPDDPVIIIYTSGTTGVPKGAMHSHRVLMNGANIARALHMERGDKVLGHMPLYHVAGSVASTIPALQAGCALIMMPHWEPGEALDLIVEERVNVMGGIPTHFIDLLAQPGVAAMDTSCLKSAWIGGAPVTPKVAQAALQTLQFDALMAVYGMTETMGATSLAPFDAPIEITCENKSKPIGDFEVKIVDPATGAEKPAGEDGEIWVRGYLVMLGYYKNPEATAEAITEDGWFKTGDLAHMDAEGYIKITGRSREMFIVGGSNAYPAEIERFIEALPMVNQAVVCGVPDARLGEVGFAFVQPAEGAPCTADDVIKACAGNIADYKVPRFVKVVPDFPRTSTNKIQRYLLQEEAVGAIAGEHAVAGRD